MNSRQMNATQIASPTASTEPTARKPLIEIGLIISVRLGEHAEQGVRDTRDQLADDLTDEFPEFEWRISVVRREGVGTNVSQEPVLLLQHGSESREQHGWDFGFLITSSDLITHYKPFALAAVSRALDLAVVSTARIEPRPGDSSLPSEQSQSTPLPSTQLPSTRRNSLLTQRLRALILHSLGHLNGLKHQSERDNFMLDFETIDDLTDVQRFTEEQKVSMVASLRKIADLRLEEQENVERTWLASFYSRSAWINRHEIFDAVWQAKPWEFPIRLTRLTTAAISSLVVLMLTAETWDLALNQTAASVTGLLVTALAATTFYVAIRQRLFIQREHHRVSEQTVIANVSATAIVLAGMVTTAALMFTISFVGSLLLYELPMVRSWAASVNAEIDTIHYALMSAFVASVGIVIGALGASFEEQHHFRHIIFVDEET